MKKLLFIAAAIFLLPFIGLISRLSNKGKTHIVVVNQDPVKS